MQVTKTEFWGITLALFLPNLVNFKIESFIYLPLKSCAVIQAKSPFQ